MQNLFLQSNLPVHIALIMVIWDWVIKVPGRGSKIRKKKSIKCLYAGFLGIDFEICWDIGAF